MAAIIPRWAHTLKREVLRRSGGDIETVGALLVEVVTTGRPLSSNTPKAKISSNEVIARLQAIAAVYAEIVGRLNRKRRAQLGIFYTPPTVAKSLVELCQLDSNETVFDPACGAGVLLLESLRHAPEQVCGWDLDEGALLLCQQLLSSAVDQLSIPTEVILCRRDLFEAQALPEFDCILMNPPFGTDLGHVSRMTREAAARSSYCGREPDQFAIAVAAVMDRSQARVGLILPDVVRMQPEYAGFRRAMLSSGRTLRVRAGQFGDFRSAAVRPCLIAASRPLESGSRRSDLEGSQPAVSGIAVSGIAVSGIAVSGIATTGTTLDGCVVDGPPEYRWRIGEADDMSLWHTCAEGATPLGDIVHVHEGVHTGNIRHKLFTSDAEAPHARPMLKGSDIWPCGFAFADRYLRYDPALIDRSRNEYASLRDPAIFKGPKLLSRQTSDRLVVAFDEGDYVTDNTIHTHRLKPGTTLTLSWLCLLLNSSLLTALYRLQSGEHKRPLPQIKLRLLRRLPIQPPAAEMSVVNELFARVLEQSRDRDAQRRLPTEVDDIVFDSYRLHPSDLRRIKALVPEV